MAEKRNLLREGLRTYFGEAELQKLGAARIGIAGAGGLGSNIAIMLARSGVEQLLLVDDDHVSASNLNRQMFWPEHVGQLKVEALAAILRKLNPDIRVETAAVHLAADNIAELFGGCSIWIEALDNAASKAIFVEKALLADKKVFAASGLCGIGGMPMQKRRVGNLLVAGDFSTGLDRANPYAPRVIQAAALVADAVLDSILHEN